MAAKRGRPKKTEKRSAAKSASGGPNPKAFNLKPAPGYIIIEPAQAEEKTQSGIYLPDSAKEDKPLKGTVLAVGDPEITDSGVQKESPVSEGDMVIYKKWGGNEVKIEGKDLLFVKYEDILATEFK